MGRPPPPNVTNADTPSPYRAGGVVVYTSFNNGHQAGRRERHEEQWGNGLEQVVWGSRPQRPRHDMLPPECR